MKYIDVTPKWVAILPAMLDVMRNEDAPFASHEVMGEAFRRMATAADNWNRVVKEGLLATDYELDRRDTPTMCWTMDCTNTELTPGTIYCDDCNAFDEDNDPIDAEDFWLDNSDLDEEVYP